VTISRDSISELLGSIQLGLEREKRLWDARELMEAPRFRSFAFFSKREEAVSRMVAALLNPTGTHGQGRLFLDRFLNNLSDDKLNDLREKQVPVSSVVVEDRTASQRRIDIVVYFGDGFQLGIENKIFGAREQLNQIRDYVDELERRRRDRFVLLFLRAEGVECISLDKEAQEDLKRKRKLILEDAKPFLSSWIEECRNAIHHKAQPVRDFLHSFQKYIQQPPEDTFMDSERTRELVTGEILKSPGTIKAALAVYAYIRSAKHVVLNGLMNKVYQELEKRVNEPDMQSDDWAMSRSSTLWPANKGTIPKNNRYTSLFQKDFQANEWRYVGIESRPPVNISVELEVGFKKQDTETFSVTVGIHKTGLYEGQKRGSKLSVAQEERLIKESKKFEAISDLVIDSASTTTEDDWHWSRSLDPSVQKLDDEAIQKLFRAWKEDTDPFVNDLVEAMVDLAKEARCALVNGAGTVN
jgi:hypothetical protein